jgi:hypothetical protein
MASKVKLAIDTAWFNVGMNNDTAELLPSPPIGQQPRHR